MAKFLGKFSTQEIILIAIIAALGLALKPFISSFVHLISTPLLIPGGSLAGGFYMFWFGIVVVLVPHRGAALLFALVQGIVTLVMGQFGNHGVMNLVIYTLPGLAVEIVLLFLKNRKSLLAQTIICSAANLTGAVIVALTIMRLPTIPLMISLNAALISGIGGGIISFMIVRKLVRYGYYLIPERR